MLERIAPAIETPNNVRAMEIDALLRIINAMTWPFPRDIADEIPMTPVRINTVPPHVPHVS
jgi:hypothetical protein